MKKINYILILALQLFCLQAIAQNDLNNGRDLAASPGSIENSDEKPQPTEQLKDGSDFDVPGNYNNTNVTPDDWMFPADLQMMHEDLSAGAGAPAVIERVNDLAAQVDALVIANEQLRKENELIRKSLEACCSDSGLSAADAYLFQNAPNPFSESSEIKYFIPDGTTGAKLEIRGIKGDMIKVYDLDITGYGKVNVANALSGAGTYIYYLNIDNEVVDSKVMVFTK